MEIVGIAFLALGGLVTFVGSIWFYIVAFQENILWGLGCLFVPFVALAFLLMHFDRAGKPFGVTLLGMLPLFLGIALMGAGGS